MQLVRHWAGAQIGSFHSEPWPVNKPHANDSLETQPLIFCEVRPSISWQEHLASVLNLLQHFHFLSEKQHLAFQSTSYKILSCPIFSSVSTFFENSSGSLYYKEDALDE